MADHQQQGGDVSAAARFASSFEAQKQRLHSACNIHAGTVRQSSRPRRSIILWWTHGPQAYPPLTERRPDDPAIRGVNRALPPRLLEHPEWSWLFSQAPLTEEERWVTLGRGAPPAAARL